jgi:hypothetical protein
LPPKTANNTITPITFVTDMWFIGLDKEVKILKKYTSAVLKSLKKKHKEELYSKSLLCEFL